MPEPVVLIFGAGANVGLSIARKFKQEGYKVAAVSRTIKDDLKQIADKTIASSLTPEEVEKIYSEVEKDLGSPNVVVYNAYSLSPALGTDPLSLSPVDFSKDLNVNATSAYAAASLAAASFAKVDPSLKTFIYTGNMCSHIILPEGFSMGVGKNAMAYVIQTAAEVYGIKGKGSKWFWYFADQRFEDGASVMSYVDGEAHAEYYWALVKGKEQGPWNSTFVKGKGYRRFEGELERGVKGMGELLGMAEERKGEL
ncbi:MAG: hypothetical protein Q9195_007879 [Heterodermia aff. obscurata]